MPNSLAAVSAAVIPPSADGRAGACAAYAGGDARVGAGAIEGGFTVETEIVSGRGAGLCRVCSHWQAYGRISNQRVAAGVVIRCPHAGQFVRIKLLVELDFFKFVGQDGGQLGITLVEIF